MTFQRRLQQFGIWAMLLSAPLVARSATPSNVVGDWISAGGKSIVRLQPCGERLCGTVIKILKPEPGRSPFDEKNADPALRHRPILGLNILSDFHPDGDHWAGKIYDPQTGKTYQSHIKTLGPDTIEVAGCIAFLCQSQTWRRSQ